MITNDWYYGSLGIDAYFNKAAPKVTAAMAKEALRAESLIVDYARAFAKAKKPGKIPKAAIPLKAYDGIVTELLDEPDMASEPWEAKMPEELQTGFIVMKMDVHNYLRSQMPTQAISTGFYAKPMPPSDSDKQRFMWMVQIINDIETALKMMNAGAFSMVENLCLRTLFPDVHSAIMVHYMEAMVDYATSAEDPYVQSWKLASLSGLTGMPVVSFSDIMHYQTGFDEQKPGQPPNPGSLKIAAAEATDIERTNHRQVLGNS